MISTTVLESSYFSHKNRWHWHVLWWTIQCHASDLVPNQARFSL